MRRDMVVLEGQLRYDYEDRAWYVEDDRYRIYLENDFNNFERKNVRITIEVLHDS